MQDREAWIARTMVELADTLVSDYDVTEFLRTLADRCVEVLGAAEVGIVLTDTSDSLCVMTSSSERIHALELHELQNEEGPCLDSVHSGAPVAVVRLDEPGVRARWPSFVPAALDAGYRQVLALPMHLREITIGAVNVFCDHDRDIPEADLRVAQALADTATIGILQERSTQRSTMVAQQLQSALNSRVVIEQAKGMLAKSHGVSVEDAFDALRSHAREHNLRLIEVAHAVVHRQLPIEERHLVDR